jgi:hypothetical protein
MVLVRTHDVECLSEIGSILSGGVGVSVGIVRHRVGAGVVRQTLVETIAGRAGARQSVHVRACARARMT